MPIKRDFIFVKIFYYSNFLKISQVILWLIICFSLFINSVLSQSTVDKYLIDSIQQIIDNKGVAGLQVAVVSKDSILFKGCFGYADLEKKIPVTDQHLFKIGSVTKSFTALAIMSLVSQGKLKLSDKLSEVAPEINFENKWETTHPVRIKHLLEHKAGFDDMHFNTFSKERWDGMTALEEINVYQQSLKSRWQPGLVHSYSNPSYAVLGFIIEKVAKIPYQQYINQQVLQPLKMSSSLFRSELNAKKTTNIANGYQLKNGQHEKVRNSSQIGETGGSLLSNLTDMIRFVQFFLNEAIQDSTVNLRNGTVAEMEKVHSWFEKENNIHYGYGLGLDNVNTEIDGVYFTGHSGGVWGFAAHFLYNKEHDLGLVIANNSETGNRKIIQFLLSHFLQKKEKENLQKTTTANIVMSADWDGYYYPVNERNGIFYFINWAFNTLQVKAEKDKLAIHYFLEGTDNYLPITEKALRMEGERIPSVYLTTTDGEKSLYYYGNYYHPINGWSLGSFKLTMGFAIMSGLLLTLLSILQGIVAFFKPHWLLLAKSTLLVATPGLSFLISVFLLASHSSLEGIIKIGQVNMVTISVFIITLLLPFISLFGMVYLFKNRHLIASRWLLSLYGMAALAGCFLAAYCINNGWFAVQLWAY